MNPFLCTFLALLLTLSEASSSKPKASSGTKTGTITNATSTPKPSSTPKHKKLAPAAIAGIVVAVFVVVVLLALLFYLKRRKANMNMVPPCNHDDHNVEARGLMGGAPPSTNVQDFEGGFPMTAPVGTTFVKPAKAEKGGKRKTKIGFPFRSQLKQAFRDRRNR